MGRGPPHFWVTTFDLFVENGGVASLLEFVVTTGVVGRFYICAVMWFFLVHMFAISRCLDLLGSGID